MASKPDKREYYRKYNEKREQKRKEDAELAKYREIKKELDENIQNNDWFNPNRNPYLNRLPGDECKKYNLEKKKRFFLQFDMNNLYSRKKGDSKSYTRKREKAFHDWYREKDLFYRIQYFRIFRREFKKRMDGESPDKTNQMMNNCFIPPELNPKSSEFRPELLHLLEEGKETDPPLKVLIPLEWAQKLIDEDSSDSYDSDFNGE